MMYRFQLICPSCNWRAERGPYDKRAPSPQMHCQRCANRHPLLPVAMNILAVEVTESEAKESDSCGS